MIKEFVPYELSLKLKNIGFDEECFGMFTEDKDFPHLVYGDGLYSKITMHFLKEECLAPLYSQAFDWCLDKLKLVESYAIIIDSDSYSLVIMDYYHNDIKENLTQLSTKEECLEKLIELVENAK